MLSLKLSQVYNCVLYVSIFLAPLDLMHHETRASSTTGAVFTNIPILVLVLTLEVYHFNHMPGFISITVSTILALKSSCRINILVN